ncbi:MAG: NUDIX hydrolase [Ignavibacteria bacterium]|nr:NUDIX hydrolase [Ignavibacteria bacterium]
MSDPSLWETIAEGQPDNWKVMNVRTVKRRHPVDGRTSDFTVCDAPSWVNIMPLTKRGTIILVEQYRHGTNSITLEIPGGVANRGEDLRLAAQRECAEETGFSSNAPAQLLGVIQPNPAFMSNVCNVYVWDDCELNGLQELDPMEDIVVREIEIKDFFAKIRNGEIQHSLVVSAAALLLLKRKFNDAFYREELVA